MQINFFSNKKESVMKNHLMLILIIIFMIIILPSCSDSSAEIKVPEEPKETTTVTQLSEANQFLGWNILNQEIIAKQDKNVIISPLSIQIALQMAANGATGATLNEILEVIGCKNCDPKSINEKTKVLIQKLSQESGHPTLSLFNCFFYDDKKLALNLPFQSSLSDYDCDFQITDFKNQNASLSLINNWVNEKTNGKIDKLLTEIKAEDIAFLINTLYFKASWTEAFPEYLSFKRDFTTSEGIKTQTAFIGAISNTSSFIDQNQAMVADIPFKDSTYSVSLISLENSSGTLDLGLYKNLMSKLKKHPGILILPKLKITYENDIIQSLKSLGMKTAFIENKADFTKIGSTSTPIFINQLKHKVALDVDEKGVEGAAVTSIVFGSTEAPPSLTFDRPFFIVLRHIKTNTIIFVGKINDPNQN